MYIAGIRSLGDISELTIEQLKQIRSLGEKSFEEIIAKITEYGVTLKEEKDIKKLNFSTRTYNTLDRAGIRTLEDISKLTIEQLKQIRNLGEKAFEEVITKISKYGIEIKSTNEEHKKAETKIQETNPQEGIDEEIEKARNKKEKLLSLYQNQIINLENNIENYKKMLQNYKMKIIEKRNKIQN